MIGRQHESHPQGVLGDNTLEHVLHEVPANRAILYTWSNRNWTEAGDRRAFIEEVTTDNVSI